jgi:hypothetical protein
MRLQRPATGKPFKRHATPSYDAQGLDAHALKESSKFKERFEAIRSARERKP